MRYAHPEQLTNQRPAPEHAFRNGVIIGAAATALAALAIARTSPAEPVSAVDMPRDVIVAYNMGHKDALKTNPPSMELEQVCLNLWANKQPGQQ